MRNLLIALAVVAFVAAPSLGAINWKLVVNDADGKILPGETTTVDLQAQCTTNKAVDQVSGGIAFSPTATLSAESFAWVAQMLNSTAPAVSGTLSSDGVAGFSAQQAIPTQSTFGNGSFVTVATLTVKGLVPGVVTLTPSAYTVAVTGGNRSNGSLPATTFPFSKDTAMGTLAGASITVTPEPVSMALLALGGLVVARRRR